MRGRAADGIERVAADEQVEIGALLAKRIVGRRTEFSAALPPDMFAHHHARIKVRIEMGAGAHTAVTIKAANTTLGKRGTCPTSIRQRGTAALRSRGYAIAIAYPSCC